MKNDSLARAQAIGPGLMGLFIVLAFGFDQTAFAQDSAAGGKTLASAPVEQLSAPLIGRFELGFAYNYINTPDANEVQDLHGFDASLFVNLTSWFAFGGDFMAGFGNNTSRDLKNITDVSLDRLVYMLGPRLNIRPKERFSIFGQALFGGAHDNTDVRITGPGFSTTNNTSDNAWAFDVSAGADWRLTDQVSWRLIQAGYMGTHFSSSTNSGWQDNWRISTGFVWSFGGKGPALSAK